MVEEVAPLKDAAQTAIPHAWRETLGAIVDSLLRGDLSIGEDLANVVPVPEDVSNQCRETVASYGSVTWIRLPEETWSTSVAMWQGNHWECLVDLWTAEEGRSDLVLEVTVTEDPETGFRFRPHLVYIP